MTGGKLVAGGGETVEGVSIDSRTIGPGQLFVAVEADRDGHEFVAAAGAAGAAAALVSRRVEAGIPQIVVANTTEALGELGRSARGRLSVPVIGITGSVGKTTTKDLLASILARVGTVSASAKSHNNELGVPLTLANTPDSAGAVVVEMGARGIGHIASLCRIAAPTVGIVTVVAGAHTEMFGSLDGIAQAKGELPASLEGAGTAVLNADDVRVAAMAARTAAQVLTFGDGGTVRAERITVGEDLRPRFMLLAPAGSIEVVLGVRGRHNVTNALAAAAAAVALDVALVDIAAGLAVGELSPWRMELGRSPSGVVVLNDAYNANPTSMAAALRSLAELPARRRVAVVGVMAELGADEAVQHREITELARSLDIELIPVGTDLYGIPSVNDARDALGSLREGDAVLVKGSRVAGLEQLAGVLLAE